MIVDDINDINDLNDNELFDLLDKIVHDKNKLEKTRKTTMCDKCDSNKNIMEDYSLGIIVCKSCGNILGNIMDKSPEWRDYDGQSGNKRCTSFTNFFLPQSSLGTSISGRNCGVKRIHSWSRMPYRERILLTIHKNIEAKCKEGKILKCIEDDAKILYHNLSKCKYIDGCNKGKFVIIRGKNKESLIAACVFFACKRKGNTRSPKEIAKLFNVNYKDFTKGCRIFLKLMKIINMKYEYKSSSPIHFVNRYCKMLKLNSEHLNQVKQIIINSEKLHIATTHTPISIATGAILFVIEINSLPISKRTLAKTYNVSDVTVAKAYKKMFKYKRILLNDNLTNDIATKMELVKKTNKSNNFSIEDDSYINKINSDIYRDIENTYSEYEDIVQKHSILNHFDQNQLMHAPILPSNHQLK